MPNLKSAIKELRKSKTHQAVNKITKDNLKDLAKKTRKAIEAKTENAQELTFKTMKALDKAAKSGAIKKNTANRKKSRLHKKLNKLTA